MGSGPPPADSRELDARRARDDQIETFDGIFLGLIHTRLKGQIRMLELRQEALLRPTERDAQHMKKMAVSCESEIMIGS